MNIMRFLRRAEDGRAAGLLAKLLRIQRHMNRIGGGHQRHLAVHLFELRGLVLVATVKFGDRIFETAVAVP